MKGKPISPNEVAEIVQNSIPGSVFDAFNECIALDWNGRSATVKQEEVIAKIISKFPPDSEGNPSISRRLIFDKKWLNVEEAYRALGWSVKYDKPGYNESYEAFFVFTKK